MNAELIYDVGAHVGEDTDFYLRKGFSVVAIEANPELAEALEARFPANVADGTLHVVNAAIAETSGEVDFYVNESATPWGTIRSEWAQRNLQLGAPSTVKKVAAVTFPEIIGTFGIPYYVKIDIEGADTLCLEGLRARAERPAFVSIESEKRSWRALRREFDLFKSLGYSRFKIVDQTRVQRQHARHPASEGRDVDHTFEWGASGLFGRELPGKWLTEREALRAYRLIFLRYRLFGDFGVLRFLLRLPIFKNPPQAKWYDTHATAYAPDVAQCSAHAVATKSRISLMNRPREKRIA